MKIKVTVTVTREIEFDENEIYPEHSEEQIIKEETQYAMEYLSDWICADNTVFDSKAEIVKE